MRQPPSGRVQTVCALRAQNFTPTEIAARLGISVRTVWVYLKRARQAGSALSLREIQVVELVSLGNSNTVIGIKLGGLSEDTVKTHISTALFKLGAEDRAHLVRRAVEEGAIYIPVKPTAMVQRGTTTKGGAP